MKLPGVESPKTNLQGARWDFKSTPNKFNSYCCLFQQSFAGNVSVRIHLLKDIQSGISGVPDVDFLVTPDMKYQTDGLLISFSRLNEALHTPPVHRLISTYPVVDTKSSIFECVRSNNIHLLRKLLASKTATPNTRDSNNESLLSVRFHTQSTNNAGLRMLITSRLPLST
jgi:hypothetical protein